MPISQKIQAKVDEIHAERVANPAGPTPIADAVKLKATRAIVGGAWEWVVYMQLFTNDPAELARLIPTDGTHDNVELNQARAYLAANGMCAPGTGDHLLDNVTVRLDLP